MCSYEQRRCKFSKEKMIERVGEIETTGCLIN